MQCHYFFFRQFKAQRDLTRKRSVLSINQIKDCLGVLKESTCATCNLMFVLYRLVTFSLEENIHCITNNKFTLPKLLPRFVFTGIIEIVGEESGFLKVVSGKDMTTGAIY